MLNPADKLMGLVGQRMGGDKLFPPVLLCAFDTSANNSFTATVRTWITLYAWGCGGAGFPDGASGHSTSCSGGGSGAGKKTILLNPGQTISWVCNNALNGNAVITLPDGLTLTAQGGQPATDYFATFGKGGLPFGNGASWDKVKKGGDGTVNTAGNPGQDGSAGGAFTPNGLGGNDAGGGGAAGFSEEGVTIIRTAESLPVAGPLIGKAGMPGGGGTGAQHKGGDGGGGDTSFNNRCRVVVFGIAA